MVKRHNVFTSYYHDQDQRCKDRLVQMMGDNIVDKSVDLGDIIDNEVHSGHVILRLFRELLVPHS